MKSNTKITIFVIALLITIFVVLHVNCIPESNQNLYVKTTTLIFIEKTDSTIINGDEWCRTSLDTLPPISYADTLNTVDTSQAFTTHFLQDTIYSISSSFYLKVVNNITQTIHDTATVTDTLYLPKPEPVFNQILTKTSRTVSWHPSPDSTMGIFLIYDSGSFSLPTYLIKTIPYPDSTCTIASDEIKFENSNYQLINIYLIAQDLSTNQSATTDTLPTIFTRTIKIWGDVTGISDKFDSEDYAVMSYFYNNQYTPMFDFNCDGVLDSLDFKIVKGN
jgi:hypothetical protein